MSRGGGQHSSPTTPAPSGTGAQVAPSQWPLHVQVTTLEVENQRKSQELVRLQTRGAQEPSRQEALALQTLVAEAEAAREDAQREVGAQHPGIPSGRSGTVRGGLGTSRGVGRLHLFPICSGPSPDCRGTPWGLERSSGRGQGLRQQTGYPHREGQGGCCRGAVGSGRARPPRGCTTEKRERTVAQQEVRGHRSWSGAGVWRGGSEVSGRRGGLASGLRVLTGRHSAGPLYPFGSPWRGPWTQDDSG